MIFGIGTDILELKRVERVYSRYGDRFAERLLLDQEYALFDKSKNKTRFLGMRFAAKEAIAKALGTGFSNGIWVRDVGSVPNRLGQPRAGSRNEVLLADDVEPSLGRQLLAPLGDQTAIGRPDVGSNIEHRIRGRHLEIDARDETLLHQAKIALLNVAPVLTQMDRDAVGPGLLGNERGREWIRVTCQSSLAQCCDVVDVDPEMYRPDHGQRASLRSAISRIT